MSHEPSPQLANLSSENLFLVTLYGEASGEPIEGQVAVGCNFMNRLKDGRWGDSLHSVLLSWAQYSCLWPTLGGKNYTRVIEFAKEFSPLVEAPKIDSFPPSIRQLMWVTGGILGGHIKDNTSGACHYYAVGTPVPRWAREGKFVGQRGAHLFFTGVK